MSVPKLILLLSVAAALASGCVGPQSRRAFHYAGYRLTGSPPESDCWGGEAYRACVYRSRSGPREEGALVWFFHYAEGDEKSLERLGLARVFFARLAKQGRPAPAIVSLSFGSHWLISSRPGQRQIVLAPRFADSILPEVEKRLGTPRRRCAWGMSMGGWNAAQLALRRPELFERVVLSCPALYAEDPFVTKGRTAKEDLGRDLFRHRMGGSEHWAADDPAALARAAGTTTFLLQPNRFDEFGFQGGARALARALGPRAQVSEAPDGHCLVDAGEAADYLAPR